MSIKRALALLSLSTLCFASAARAEQPRDWMVGPQPGGTVLNLDAFFPGIQAQVEHRVPIYGVVNELWLKANTMLALPFNENQVDVDLRLVVLSLGGSVGYRNAFRTFEFEPGEAIDREHRRARELAGKVDSVSNAYGEGRLQLALPFNDDIVFLSIDGLRYEGGPDRVFDYRAGIVRDSGFYLNSNNTLFLKSHRLGSAGPQLQILNFAYDGRRYTTVNYGFTVVARPGFLRKNDLFFLSMLFNFDTSGSYRAGDVYGQHLFYAPVNFQLAYRMVFELGTKALGDDDDDER